VESLLEGLRPSIEIIYSSELVPGSLMEAQPRTALPPLERARRALADHRLALRLVAPNRYVVIADSSRPTEESPTEPMEEISVYASRYSIGSEVGEPKRLAGADIENVPGSHDDAIHAVRSLPGVVSNASGRPYIRGSLSEDVLVRYDGITLLDPFHLKNFQSLISAIDPAVVDHIEVFSGGFPVQYGRRSGGVIDIAAPSVDAGYQNQARLSLISAGVSTIGRSDSLPLEWLGSIRRSVIDQIEQLEDKPQFADSLGRLRWTTEKGAWTAGWLLLDDRLELGDEDEGERASARYRDEYFWLSRQHRFSDALQSRTTIVGTSAERSRDGELQRTGVASGLMSEKRSFNGLDLTSDWIYAPGASSSYTFGAALGSTRADYKYSRVSMFGPEVAREFNRSLAEQLDYTARPRVINASVYAANRRRWAQLEAEVGLRVDAQHYERGGNHTQVSPRLNLRYDLRDRLRLYASAGRFTQAQHVEEWRVEEAQQRPDAAQVAIHSVLGAEYELRGGGSVGLEIYSKQWTTTAPYFDNALDAFSLLPDLNPDRVRVAPQVSEAAGFELRTTRPLTDHITGWGTFAWSRVADEFGARGDVLRSWDQPLSLSTGLAWTTSRASISLLAGWHTGWPRTPTDAAPFRVGERNSARWSDFYSLDLRGSWSWRLSHGSLTMVLDATNATNRDNDCCFVLGASSGPTVQGHVDHWLPTIVNLGVTYRWGKQP
jgi:outer membrane receptor protein involved in Fe transport